VEPSGELGHTLESAAKPSAAPLQKATRDRRTDRRKEVRGTDRQIAALLNAPTVGRDIKTGVSAVIKKGRSVRWAHVGCAVESLYFTTAIFLKKQFLIAHVWTLIGASAERERITVKPLEGVQGTQQSPRSRTNCTNCLLEL